MANGKDITINLKTIAKTGDAKQLLDYIDKLQEKLKAVTGTDDLQKQLNGIRDAIKPGTTSPEDVKKLLPDISKINIQQYIATARNKLKEIGTAQAKVMQETLGKWDKTVAEGNLSEEALSNMAPYMEKFVAQANKLPPQGLKAMVPILERMKESSQEALDTFTELNDIHFNFKGEAKTLEEVAHRIQMIGEARDVEGSLDELVQVLDSLPADKAKEAQEQVDKLKKTLSGELSGKSAAEIKKLSDGFLALQKNLDPKQFEKVAPALTKASSAAKTLSDSLKKTGNELEDSFDGADAAAEAFGVHVGQTERTIGSLLAKIPLIGKAIAGIPIGWVLLAIGVIVKGVTSLIGLLKDAGEADRQITFENAKRNLEQIEESSSRYLDLLDMAKEKQDLITDSLRNQLEAQLAIEKAQIEISRRKELQGVQDENSIERINRKYDELIEKKEYESGQKGLSLDEAKTNTELETVQKEIARLEQNKRGLEGSIEISSSIATQASLQTPEELYASENGSGQSWIAKGLRYWGRKAWNSTFGENPAEDVEKHQEIFEKAQNDLYETTKKIEEKKRRQTELLNQIDIINKKKQADTENEKARELERQKKQEERDRRYAQERHNFQRSEEVRTRDQAEEEREYQRGRGQIGQGTGRQLEDAQREFDRWSSLEKDLSVKREGIVALIQKEIEANRKPTPEMETALSEVTADLDRARQNRYKEQGNIDSINHQIEVDKRAKAREQELYEYDREMAETNYQRGRRSPWQNEAQQLEEAEKMLKRYRQEEKEAFDERERVMKEVAAQGGWQTITEEQEFRFNNATSDLVRARSSRYQEQSTIDQLQKQIHDRQFQESESRHSIEKEDADWQRGRLYNRANYAQRLRMDKAMYDKAKAEYEEANAAILADNAGTKTLSPEERQVMERRRNEARGYLTQSRDAISNAMYEGDTQTMGFFNSLMKQGNRLTQMGLGGDVANWDKQTAHNTKTLVSQNRDLMRYFQSNRRNGGMDMTWGL